MNLVATLVRWGKSEKKTGFKIKDTHAGDGMHETKAKRFSETGEVLLLVPSPSDKEPQNHGGSQGWLAEKKILLFLDFGRLIDGLPRGVSAARIDWGPILVHSSRGENESYAYHAH